MAYETVHLSLQILSILLPVKSEVQEDYLFSEPRVAQLLRNRVSLLEPSFNMVSSIRRTASFPSPVIT